MSGILAEGFYWGICSVTTSVFSMPDEVKHTSWVLIKAKKKKKDVKYLKIIILLQVYNRMLTD